MNNEINLRSKMGKQATDKITGFSGTITAVCMYVTGCDQYSITAKAKDNFTPCQSGWYDVNRIEIHEDQPKLVIENENTKGAMTPPPSY